MTDYGYGMGDEELAEVRKLEADVQASPDEFENWEKLVRAVEGLEGGLNRNSSPQAITAARSIHDRFLAKFPLFFGYWKKYADLEFAIAGTEAAEMVSQHTRPRQRTLLTWAPGLRARRSQHWHLGRPLGQLL
jgi:pre-mRNA-processing factor 39